MIERIISQYAETNGTYLFIEPARLKDVRVGELMISEGREFKSKIIKIEKIFSFKNRMRNMEHKDMKPG